MIKGRQDLTKNLKSLTLYPSRILAVQTIYSYQILKKKKNIIQISSEYIEYHNLKYKHNNLNLDFYHTLIKLTTHNIVEIDEKIKWKLDKKWKIERLPEVVLSILRVGIGEIIKTQYSTIAIVINDYLQIAKSLNHFKELSFINSILDKIAKNSTI